MLNQLFCEALAIVLSKRIQISVEVLKSSISKPPIRVEYLVVRAPDRGVVMENICPHPYNSLAGQSAICPQTTRHDLRQWGDNGHEMYLLAPERLLEAFQLPRMLISILH